METEKPEVGQHRDRKQAWCDIQEYLACNGETR